MTDLPCDYDRPAAQYAAEGAALAAESAALSSPRIVAVHSIEGETAVVLAVLTEPIYLSSERKALEECVEEDATRLSGKRVYLTFDMEIYRALDKNTDRETALKLFTKVTEGREVF